MKVLVFLVAACAVVYGQEPQPCIAPKLWEARMSRIDPAKRFYERARISYDAINRRVRIIEEVNIKEQRDFFDVLFLHEVGKEYKFNLRTKECAVSAIAEQFRPFEVPPNATSFGESYIGTGAFPGEGVLITLWGGEAEQPAGRYMATFTNSGCVPVEDGFCTERFGCVHTAFYDVVAGISDPNVFIPPRECE
ncbi:mammalian ependymin-related protein 1-like [Branchiostoma floridae x Branchiostoma belcheri]